MSSKYEAWVVRSREGSEQVYLNSSKNVRLFPEDPGLATLSQSTCVWQWSENYPGFSSAYTSLLEWWSRDGACQWRYQWLRQVDQSYLCHRERNSDQCWVKQSVSDCGHHAGEVRSHSRGWTCSSHCCGSRGSGWDICGGIPERGHRHQHSQPLQGPGSLQVGVM